VYYEHLASVFSKKMQKKDVQHVAVYAFFPHLKYNIQDLQFFLDRVFASSQCKKEQPARE
jgi:hypothetical protein